MSCTQSIVVALELLTNSGEKWRNMRQRRKPRQSRTMNRAALHTLSAIFAVMLSGCGPEEIILLDGGITPAEKALKNECIQFIKQHLPADINISKIYLERDEGNKFRVSMSVDGGDAGCLSDYGKLKYASLEIQGRKLLFGRLVDGTWFQR